MTLTYKTVVTDKGAELIAQCLAEGAELKITKAAVGDGGGETYEPDPSQTDLKNACWEGEIEYVRQDTGTPNMVNIRFEVPSDLGGFTIREAAVYAEDGTMIAICNTPDYAKTTDADGMLGKYIIVMHVLVTDSSAVEFYINSDLDYMTRAEVEDLLAGYVSIEAFANAFTYDAATETITITTGG